MTITSNIAALKQSIRNTEITHHRTPGSVHLLAVSKQRSVLEITEAFHAGIRDFGENYLQEALEKMHPLSHLTIDWHFIGPIQSNKARAIAQHFHWVHTVSTFAIAQRLNGAREPNSPLLNVCIQINIDNEQNKAGIHPNDALDLASKISTLPYLALRGLMIIPKPELDIQKQYATFLKIAHLLQDINQTLALSMDTLSMGMSNDFKTAIQAGSTMVRIGTAVFGLRPHTRP